MALAAAAWGDVAVLLWAASVGGLAAAATVWARVAWRDVTVDAEIDPGRAFLGEEITLLVRIVNAKRLPLPIVRVTARYPEGLLAEPSPDPRALRGHRRRLSLPGRSETLLRLPIITPSRGEYWIESIEVEISDPFDLVPLRREIAIEQPLLVMPEAHRGVPLAIRRRLPFGRPVPGARLFEDREHLAGVRDYEPGDPVQWIHWKLSAHAGQLLTKQYEATRSAEVLIAIDLANGEPFWSAVDPSTAERTIGWASFLARQAIGAGWRTGLVANTHLRRGRGPLRVRVSATHGHEAALFAALARMPSQPTSDLAPVLREVGRRLVRRSTAVVLSPRPGAGLRTEMEVLRRRGVEVIYLSPLEGLPSEVGA